MNIIIELQKVAQDSNIKVSDLLRKALVVATKLKVKTFKTWIENELHGYETPPTPKYRHIKGQIMTFHPYRGWIDVNIEDKEVEKKYSQDDILQPIGEIESMVIKDEVIAYNLNGIKLDDTSKSFGLKPRIIIHKSAFIGLIESVRTIVLEWALKLEDEGIIGDEHTFSDIEKEKATNITVNIEKNYGMFGNIEAGEINIKYYDSIHSNLKELGVSQSERNKLEKIIDSLEGSPQKAEKNSLVKKGFQWLKNNSATLGTLSNELREWIDKFQ